MPGVADDMDTDTGTAQVIDSEVVVVGAGQAGLSTAHHLARRGYAPGSELVVLDGSPAPGGAWQHSPGSSAEEPPAERTGAAPPRSVPEPRRQDAPGTGDRRE